MKEYKKFKKSQNFNKAGI